MTIKQAILFAGQGAQFVGMGQDFTQADPECKALFSKANDILGYDLAELCFKGPETELVKSIHCQPAIFVASVVCYLALCRENRSVVFEGSAGLSLGEWSALFMAEAISFEDALRVLAARGRFMQEACEERDGAMLSVIGLSVDALKRVAETAGVEIANFNSPQQIVLSGERKRIQDAEKLSMEAGAKRVVMLNVAGAYHSSLMAAAGQRLERFMKDMQFQTPRLPVLSNVTGHPHGSPEDIKRNMILQITSPVKWVSCTQWFKQQGVTRYIECGPGRVLSGLVKRIHPEAFLCHIQDRHSLAETLAVLSK